MREYFLVFNDEESCNSFFGGLRENTFFDPQQLPTNCSCHDSLPEAKRQKDLNSQATIVVVAVNEEDNNRIKSATKLSTLAPQAERVPPSAAALQTPRARHPQLRARGEPKARASSPQKACLEGRSP